MPFSGDPHAVSIRRGGAARSAAKIAQNSQQFARFAQGLTWVTLDATLPAMQQAATSSISSGSTEALKQAVRAVADSHANADGIVFTAIPGLRMMRSYVSC